ncbi:MAG: phosphoglucomutase [Spirochaetae bacterium HGW-Spirochaetae-1]|jgi:phosphoglucomutase|nr:MAG: phosphoglucomutase [Spirochaetae bacterium HGW-Spirochaetae-1]
MNQEISDHIKDWTRKPFDRETIDEIQSLVDTKNETELIDRFYTHLEFGTGGLRGIIGAGTNRVNVYTIGMASQGLANYIIANQGQSKGVVIARDSRRMSDVFARETAAIMAANGIKVYYFNDITPTPLGSFAIREYGAMAGVVITASHNPPEYNGYKVYWEDGGQIVPPHDKNIIDEVKKIHSISEIRRMDFDTGAAGGVITVINNEITESYIRQLEKYTHRTSTSSDISIVYSPLHGSGYSVIPEVLRHFGFNNIHLEEKQSIPDADFSTVKSPNPEEKETMSLAIEMAEKIGADIVLATDPDADRMGVAFKDSSGNYTLINGNQIGTMLEYYILARCREDSTLPAGATVIKTIVTTELQREVASSFQCGIIDVLTGFKWIAARMKDFDADNSRTFLFGGEESYGYLPVPFVRDKDAVSSCYFFAEMTDWLKRQGKTLHNLLDEIYLKYGLYLEDLHSLTLKGKDGLERIRDIMKSFRQAPPKDFGGRAVKEFRDIKSGTVTNLITGDETILTDLPSSDVLQFLFVDGTVITMRPSGTEPKIKFYFSVKKKTSRGMLKEDKADLYTQIDMLKKELLAKVESM